MLIQETHFVFALLSPFTILAYQTSHRPFIQRTII